MLAKIKTALRITHSQLDGDIESTIESAKQELKRVGVDVPATDDAIPDIVYSAIKTYCQMFYTDDEKKREMFYKSFECQADGLRKSTEYGGDSDDV